MTTTLRNIWKKKAVNEARPRCLTTGSEVEDKPKLRKAHSLVMLGTHGQGTRTTADVAEVTLTEAD